MDQLKKHLSDSIAYILQVIRTNLGDGEAGAYRMSVIGEAAPERAALFISDLIRYPDFIDNHPRKVAASHPTDLMLIIISLKRHHAFK